MARIARVIAPGYPHHITQRGNRRKETFASFPMDETYLLATVRYLGMNPVASGFVVKPEDIAWNSARAHLKGADDLLVHVAPHLEIVGNGEAFLGHPKEQEMKNFQLHEKTGRPLGSDMFVNRFEDQLVRTLRPLQYLFIFP